VPALAAALRSAEQGAAILPANAALAAHLLVPMYRLAPGSVEEEAHAAAVLVGEVGKRMQRLTQAYGEWQLFEPVPYFDLAPAQVEQLTQISERVSSVHAFFFVDALLPAFQAVHDCAVAAFQLAAAGLSADWMDDLVARWHRLIAVIALTRCHLSEDIAFLSLNAGIEEQARWSAMAPHEPDRATPWHTTGHLALPTLTLMVDFPLPAFRQSGRLRRLRRSHQRRRALSVRGGRQL